MYVANGFGMKRLLWANDRSNENLLPIELLEVGLIRTVLGETIESQYGSHYRSW